MKLAKVAFAGLNNPTNYKIHCGEIARSTFQKVVSPISDIISEFFHYSNSACYQWFDGHRLEIATWPQYARTELDGSAMAHISGYVYGVPDCIARAEHRSLVVGNLIEPFGENISHYANATMPLDYASFSVVGAEVLLSNGADTQQVATSGLFGHFQTFVTLSPNTTTANLTLQGCEASLPLQNPAPPVNKPFDIIPVSRKGLSIVADLDDVLRVTEIWNWKQMLLSVFVRPFIPWSTMPETFKAWNNAVPDAHFHYATDTPEMSHQFLVDGVSKYYPPGSFGFRPMTFESADETLSPRYMGLKRLLEMFPERKFVLLGDDSTGSVLSTYARLGKEFPKQVQCIMIRDVGATEPANWIVGNTAALNGLPHMFFERAEDLLFATGLLQRLAEGEEAGCGILGGQERERNGWVRSWILTAHGGLSAVMRCMMVWNVRPNGNVCRFDRRSGTGTTGS